MEYKEKSISTIEMVGKKCVGCRSCEQKCPKGCISIKANNAGIPKIVIISIVIIFIGIITLIGKAKILYPYNKKELKISFFRNLNTNLIISSPLNNMI